METDKPIYQYTNEQVLDFWKNCSGKEAFFNSVYYEVLAEEGLFDEFVSLINANKIINFAIFLQKNSILNKVSKRTKDIAKYSCICLWWFMAYAYCECNVNYRLMPGYNWVLNIPMEPFDVYLKNTLPEDPYNTYSVLELIDTSGNIIDGSSNVVDGSSNVVDGSSNVVDESNVSVVINEA